MEGLLSEPEVFLESDRAPLTFQDVSANLNFNHFNYFLQVTTDQNLNAFLSKPFWESSSHLPSI